MAEDGLARFQRRMRAIPKSVRASVRSALIQGAEEIAAAAEHLAPEDQGDLVNSIRATPPGGTTPNGTHLHELQAAVSAGSDEVPHARWIEHGTRNMPAQPYFFPAYRSLRKRASGRIKRAMAKGIREARG